MGFEREFQDLLLRKAHDFALSGGPKLGESDMEIKLKEGAVPPKAQP